MLSDKQKVKHPSKFDRPLLAEPITYRVVYQKRGNLQFFSHLDLQRTWQRVLVRAAIPMWYTQGFNPHSKIVFGVPMICDAMRKGGAKAPIMVLEAADTSENTHKKISDKCAYYKVEHIRLTADGASLAAAVGKSGSIGAVALTDPGMSEMLRRHL